MKGILSYCDEPIVSSDLIGHPASSIFDVGRDSVKLDLFKLVSWYDNEKGYSERVVDLIEYGLSWLKGFKPAHMAPWSPKTAPGEPP